MLAAVGSRSVNPDQAWRNRRLALPERSTPPVMRDSKSKPILNPNDADRRFARPDVPRDVPRAFRLTHRVKGVESGLRGTSGARHARPLAQHVGSRELSRRGVRALHLMPTRAPLGARAIAERRRRWLHAKRCGHDMMGTLSIGHVD